MKQTSAVLKIVASLLLGANVLHVDAGEYIGYRLAALKTISTVVFVDDYGGSKRITYVREQSSAHVLPPTTIEPSRMGIAQSLNENEGAKIANPLVVRVYDRFVVANIVGPLSYFDLYNPDGSRKQRRELDYFGIDISRRGDASLVVCQKGVVWMPNEESTIIWQPKFWLANERSTRPGVIGPIGIEFELKAIWRPKKW